MISELRSDLQTYQSRKKNKRRPASVLRKLSLVGFGCGDERRRKPCSLLFSCEPDQSALTRARDEDGRKAFLKDNRNYLRHRSYGCLIRQGEIISFATIDRDIDKLALDPPVVTLEIAEEEALKKTLLSFKMFRDVDFVLVDTPFFTYEPILRCLQETTDMALADDLLFFEPEKPASPSRLIPDPLLEQIRREGTDNLGEVLNINRPVTLDPSQLESLLSGLTQRLSIIQGPPGNTIIITHTHTHTHTHMCHLMTSSSSY